jgi:hypothetical protein
MGRLFDAVVDYLKADEWYPHLIENETACSMTFQGQTGQWTCVAETFEDDDEFVFYSGCPIQAPQEKRHSIAELLCRINYVLTIGNFEMDFEDGEIRCRTSLNLMGHPLGAMLISQIVYQNVTAMNHYLPAILMIIKEDLSPTQALEKLELDSYLASEP